MSCSSMVHSLQIAPWRFLAHCNDGDGQVKPHRWQGGVALRTLIVAAVILPLVVVTGKWSNPLLLPWRTQLFRVLSALATGAAWLVYFRALQSGELAKVAVVDKFSVVLVIVLATRK